MRLFSLLNKKVSCLSLLFWCGFWLESFCVLIVYEVTEIMMLRFDLNVGILKYLVLSDDG